jgi:hypothetical protein
MAGWVADVDLGAGEHAGTEAAAGAQADAGDAETGLGVDLGVTMRTLPLTGPTWSEVTVAP